MGGRSAAVTMLFLLADCRAWRLQPGLSNVPAADRPWGDDDFAHDFVTNGDESCASPSGGPEANTCFFSKPRLPIDPRAYRGRGR